MGMARPIQESLILGNNICWPDNDLGKYDQAFAKPGLENNAAKDGTGRVNSSIGQVLPKAIDTPNS
jgi:hypothetical protein